MKNTESHTEDTNEAIRRPRVGFLTYDLQEFTADCLSRIVRRAGEFRVKAYPILPRTSKRIDFEYQPSAFEARHRTFAGPNHTPEGLMMSVNWKAAWKCARENEIVVLFGIQGGTALLLTFLAWVMRRKLISVNQTLPPACEMHRRWWVRLLKGWILRRCDIHITQTPVTRDTLREVYGLAEECFVTAPFEAGWSLFEALRQETEGRCDNFREELGWEEKDCVFLFVGTLVSYKGVHCILSAMREIRNEGRLARVVLCGPDAGIPSEWSIEEYNAETRRLGIDDVVHFTNGISASDLSGYYRNSDVFVLPTSRDMWPKVLVEAASFGLPLITTTSCGAAGSLVREGETGIVIPPSDHSAMARAMKEMMRDPARRESMGRKAREFCEVFCDPDKEAAGYVEAFHAVSRAA